MTVKTALLLIDFQRDFLAPDGRMGRMEGPSDEKGITFTGAALLVSARRQHG